MAPTLPFAIRLAAGVLAAGADQLRRLPAELPEISVTVAGRLTRASMRIQQEVTALASRGEELLDSVLNPPQEHPPWAHFDDDPAAAPPAAGTVDDDGPDPAAAAADTGDGAVDGAAGDTDADDTAVGAAGPGAMPGYDGYSLPQVRARLRGLDAAAVEQLLAHERAGRARAGLLTMLSNRLETLAAADGAADGAPARPGRRA